MAVNHIAMQFLHRVINRVRFFVALTAFAVLPGYALAEGDVVQFTAHDPVMSAAITQANQTLPRFMTHVFGTRTHAPEAALLKVAFPKSTGDGDEIIWVDRLTSLGDRRFRGHLANQPHYLDGHYLGSEVQFTLSDIRDWGFTDARSGLMYGHYTTRVVIQNIPAETRAQISALLADPPLPLHW